MSDCYDPGCDCREEGSILLSAAIVDTLRELLRNADYDAALAGVCEALDIHLTRE